MCYNLRVNCGHMVHPNVNFLRAVGMMIGAIIGVGVFGLPYAFAQSGVGLGLLELLVLGGFLLILQLMLGEVSVQTPGKHRLVSLVEIHVGRPWKWVALIAMGLGVWGAMLAYMVVGGEFLFLLLSPVFGGAQFVYSYIVAFSACLLIYGGLRFASRIEIVVVGVLLFLFLFIILMSAPHVDVSHYFSVDFSNAFLPYGVILFSAAGVGIIPEIKDVLGKKHKREMGPVLITGMTIILSLYALFALVVVGVTGPETTQTAFEGLIGVLGGSFGVLATLLGAVTIISIYMVLGIELLNTFKFDFTMPHKMAWALVCFVPILLYTAGVREFISIIGFVGGVFGGMLSILIALSYWNMRRGPLCRKHHCINFPEPLTWVLILLFSTGVILQLARVLIK